MAEKKPEQRIVVWIYPSGGVKVIFRGAHIDKRTLQRAQKAIGLGYRERVRDHRLAVRQARQGKTIKGDIDNGGSSGQKQREELRGRPTGVFSISSGARGTTVDEGISGSARIARERAEAAGRGKG